MSSTGTAFFFALAMGTPAPVEWLEQATACRSAGDFECADLALTRARGAMVDAPWQIRRDILELSAELAFSLSRPDAAREHVAALLDLDPAFDPGTAWAPAWRAVLGEVRRARPDITSPTLTLVAPDSTEARSAFVVRANVEDMSGVDTVTLLVGDTRIAMARAEGDGWVGVVPAERVAPPQVEVRVEAWDALGNGPAVQVVRVPVSVGAGTVETPIHERWWFWATIGAVAIGVGLGVGLAATHDGDARPATRRVIWSFE